MTKQRKKMLTLRAAQYAEANRGNTPSPRSAVARAYEDGYRAAMSDLRKVLKKVAAENPLSMAPSPAEVLSRNRELNRKTRTQVCEWLRPLR